MTDLSLSPTGLSFLREPSLAPSGLLWSDLPELDVQYEGQVFTPPHIVRRMVALRQNIGRLLEPSAGDGAFLRGMPGEVAIEKDARLAADLGVTPMDFFDYPLSEQFATIIGNPPYVRHRDIAEDTRAKLDMRLFDRHANLFLFFIEKAVRHLQPGGELIFITPRDFCKLTSARRLNEMLFRNGTITHFEDLGDAKVFQGACPNCAIWRFEKGNMTHRMADGREFRCVDGQLYFDAASDAVLGELFEVKVGAVSGADSIFASEQHGTLDFVCSRTAVTGQTRRMIYNQPHPALRRHKGRLLRRKIRNFGEDNWWEWGRRYPETDRPRIYVNSKTRNPRPFFLHKAKAFDGSVLALFPKDERVDLVRLRDWLNDVDWQRLGFVCDGRFLFSQRSLETAAVGGR